MEIRFPEINFKFEIKKQRGSNNPFELETELTIISGEKEAIPVAPYVDKFGPKLRVWYSVRAQLSADSEEDLNRLIDLLKLVPVAIKRSMQDQLDGFKGQSFHYRWTSHGTTVDTKKKDRTIIFV